MYFASLDVAAEFSGLQYLLYSRPLITCVVSTFFLFFPIFFSLLCLFYAFVYCRCTKEIETASAGRLTRNNETSPSLEDEQRPPSLHLEQLIMNRPSRDDEQSTRPRDEQPMSDRPSHGNERSMGLCDEEQPISGRTSWNDKQPTGPSDDEQAMGSSTERQPMTDQPTHDDENQPMSGRPSDNKPSISSTQNETSFSSGKPGNFNLKILYPKL